MKRVYNLSCIFWVFFCQSIFAQNWSPVNFQSKVNGSLTNVVGQFDHIEFEFELKEQDPSTGAFSIPISTLNFHFDTTIIDVFSEITFPNGTKTIRSFGFFDIESDNSEITCGANRPSNIHNPISPWEDHITYNNPIEKWKFRYTPTETGIFNYIIKINFRGIIKTIIGTFQCIVNLNPNKSGFVKIDETNSKYFKIGGSNKVFYPIGLNVNWSDGHNPINNYEEYTGFCDFKDYMDKAVPNGVNFFRIWLGVEHNSYDLTLYDYQNWKDPSGTWYNLFDFRFNYSMINAKRLDEIIEYAESKGIYIQLTIFNPCLDGECWYTSRENQAIWANPNSIGTSQRNVLRYSPKTINHFSVGECSTPFDFFSTKLVSGQLYPIDRQQNLLRYLAARYSYSQNILAWESGNEVENEFTKSLYDEFVNPYYNGNNNNLKNKDLKAFTIDFQNSEDAYLRQVSRWSAAVKRIMNYYDPNHLFVSGQRVGQPNYKVQDITSNYGFDCWTDSKSDFIQMHLYLGCPNDEKTFGSSFQPPAMYSRISEFRQNAKTKQMPIWFQEFDWYFEKCLSPMGPEVDPFGFYYHQVIWANTLQGVAGCPLNHSWSYIRANMLFPIYRGLSNYINNKIQNFGSSIKEEKYTNNYYNAYGITNTTDGINRFYIIDNRYRSFELIKNNKGYLGTLNTAYKPAPLDLNISKLSLDVTNNGDYLVTWYSTITGNIIKSEIVKVENNLLKIGIEEDIKSVYGDAVFEFSRICVTSVKFIARHGNHLKNTFSESQLTNYSTINSPLSLNYGEDVLIDLSMITNKKSLNIKFIEIDNFGNNTTYTSTIQDISTQNDLSFLQLFRQSQTQFQFFRSNNNSTTYTYKIELQFNNTSSGCNSTGTMDMFFRIWDCHTFSSFLINGVNSYKSPTTALSLNYGEDFIIDGLNCTGEVTSRVSIVEIDEFGNNLSSIEPYYDFQGDLGELKSFNNIYPLMVNKYQGNYLNPSLSSDPRYYKIKLILMNAYSNQGCDQWNEDNFYVKIASCASLAKLKLNGINSDILADINNPLILNYAEDILIDATNSTGEVAYRISYREVDQNGSYLTNFEPHVWFNGDCKNTLLFNSIYNQMYDNTNGPVGSYLPPSSTGSRYYKIKLVVTNAYSNDGCTNWDEQNAFVKISSCQSVPKLKVNGSTSSSFSNPINIAYGDKIILDPTETIGETSFKIFIKAVDNNGNDILNDPKWTGFPEYSVNGPAKETFNLISILGKMTSSPNKNPNDIFEYLKNYPYYRIVLVSMNSYNNQGCSSWEMTQEYIKFDYTLNTSCKVNNSVSNCLTITYEDDPIIASDFVTKGSVAFNVIFEKIENCDPLNPCTNCMVPSEELVYTQALGLNKDDVSFRNINGVYLLNNGSNSINSLNLRELYFSKYGSYEIPSGIYQLKLEAFPYDMKTYTKQSWDSRTINERYTVRMNILNMPHFIKPFSTNSRHLTDNTTDHVLIKDSLIRNISSPIRFVIYPNPFESNVTILVYDSDNGGNSKASVSIMTLDNRVVYNCKSSIVDNQFQLTNLDDLSAGIYYIKINYLNSVYNCKLLKL